MSLPRASLTQKIEVLDYYHGPPQRSQRETLDKFQADARFALSQASISSWLASESKIRTLYESSPHLVNYKKNPVLKYPEVMKAVEKDIGESAATGAAITDAMIRDSFTYYAGIYGYDRKRVSMSTGMLYSFKRRNHISRGRKSTVPTTVPTTAPSPSAAAPPPGPTVTSMGPPGAGPHSPHHDPPHPSHPVAPGIAPPEFAAFGPDLNPPDHVTNILQHSSLGFNTRLIHSDDSYSNFFNIVDTADAPAGTASTVDPTAVVSDGALAAPQVDLHADVAHRKQNFALENFSYSRTTHPNSEKVEKILENITNGYVTLYNSGTSAIMGLLTLLNCRKIAINSNGYQGTHQVIKLLSKLTGIEKIALDECDQLARNDIMIIESPMNPEGYCVDIAKYSRLAHSRGALLAVDSTLAPPPLQDPFVQGADYIIHSATKYFSGHSDLLAGFIVCKTKEIKAKLMEERFSLGTNIANFDSFLLLRSLRTFKMRILQQCSNTFQLIKFLAKNLAAYPIIIKIHHSSLQPDAFVQQQLNGYYNPVFAVEVKSMEIAKSLMTKFKFVNPKPNTSSGGGETTVELANLNPNFFNLDAAESDSLRSFGIRGNILRFSVGCEDYQDLVQDVDQALSSFDMP